MLFTRKSRTEYEVLDARYPSKMQGRDPDWANFQTNKPTKIIIHGFKATVQRGKWMYNMMNELLDNSDFNVVIVDWTGGFGFLGIDYPQAVANTRVVGAQVADLINTIVHMSSKQKPHHFHIIGHSLGAHIAGYAGERVGGLGRISGLDPASPYFKNYGRLVRLDDTDALFVDVIHTDTGRFGIKQTVGHADFYPNGGQSQPACGGVQKSVERYFTCNHEMAYLYFIESINSLCRFSNGMGFYAVKPGSLTEYYPKTNSRSPYCG